MPNLERMHVPPNLYEPLILRLKTRRMKQGIRLEYVAMKINVNANTIGQWENCEKYPSFMKLVLWAEALNYQLTLIDIFAHDDLDLKKDKKP